MAVVRHAIRQHSSFRVRTMGRVVLALLYFDFVVHMRVAAAVLALDLIIVVFISLAG